VKDFIRHNFRWLLVAGAVIAPVVLYACWQLWPTPPQFVTVPVSKGAVVRAVVTTGAVNPVVTVQVGSYVSGVIQTLYCDYNTEVKAGQLCAKIDPRPYQVVVDQNAANLASGEAQLRKDKAALVYAKINYERDLNLRKRGIVSQDAVDNDKSAVDQGAAQIGVDEAAIQQHRAALSAAQVNLDYTNIISPVDGIVVSRSIDVGQTVAASFQTPTLFLIAKDLTKMQVDTNVSESDVGAAKVGQKASFTVESYQGKIYWGQVTQLRQAPITVQNVVTYDVVVSVDNPDLTLLPGMTANTRIITDERRDVLRVPITALRFTPSGSSPPPAVEGGGERPAGGGERSGGKHAAARVWALHNGRPEAVPVTTGLSDNTYAEITGGDLKPDDLVIVNEIRAGEAKVAHAPTAPVGVPHRF
jgi:HlyD family secretion protein